MSAQSLLDFEINTLEANRHRIEGSRVAGMILHSVKGKYICETSRKNFMLSRTLPVDKVYDPIASLSQAKTFLDCNAEVLERSQGKCKAQYTKIYDCFSSNKTPFYFPSSCVSQMEDFINC